MQLRSFFSAVGHQEKFFANTIMFAEGILERNYAMK